MTSLSDLKKYKEQQRKISMITCYDHWSANVLKETSIDILLVGDSVSMVVHGFDSTIHATTEMMASHTAAVARAQTTKHIVTDLPFLVHEMGRKKLMKSIDQLMKAGAQSLKLETRPGQYKALKQLAQAGIPLMGHLGLTPQYIHQLGGYKVQGRGDQAHNQLLDHAQKLQEAGCQALVLECVPSTLAKEITETLEVPTIGIGAGPYVDGQVLVLQDLLGLNKNFKPRFVRQFAQGHDWMQKAVENYSQAVDDHSFPSNDEAYQ